MAIFYVGAGLNHFLSPAFYQSVMPSYIPWPGEVIVLTRVAEILGGFGVIFPQTRRWAGIGLIALLIGILPVHIQMLIDGFRGTPMWILWLRLPLQVVLIWWVCACCFRPAPARR